MHRRNSSQKLKLEGKFRLNSLRRKAISTAFFLNLFLFFRLSDSTRETGFKLAKAEQIERPSFRFGYLRRRKEREGGPRGREVSLRVRGCDGGTTAVSGDGCILSKSMVRVFSHSVFHSSRRENNADPRYKYVQSPESGKRGGGSGGAVSVAPGQTRDARGPAGKPA